MLHHDKIEIIHEALNRNSKLCEEWAKRLNINYNVFLTFYALYENKKLTQKQIAETYRMLKQTVNNVITDLKKNEYILLQTDPNNKREKLIELTPKGLDFANQFVLPFMEIEGVVIERMGQENTKQMIDAMHLYGDLFEEVMNDKLEEN